MEAEKINRFRFRYLLWVIVTTVPIYLKNRLLLKGANLGVEAIETTRFK